MNELESVEETEALDNVEENLEEELGGTGDLEEELGVTDDLEEELGGTNDLDEDIENVGDGLDFEEVEIPSFNDTTGNNEFPIDTIPIAEVQPNDTILSDNST